MFNLANLARRYPKRKHLRIGTGRRLTAATYMTVVFLFLPLVQEMFCLIGGLICAWRLRTARNATVRKEEREAEMIANFVACSILILVCL